MNTLTLALTALALTALTLSFAFLFAALARRILTTFGLLMFATLTLALLPLFATFGLLVFATLNLLLCANFCRLNTWWTSKLHAEVIIEKRRVEPGQLTVHGW